MTTGKILIVSALILLGSFVSAQSVNGVYKIKPLLERTAHPDTLYVLNFWATWCKPCVKELPVFDSLVRLYDKQPVKVLLVSLDFSEQIKERVNPFLAKNKVLPECVLLDEVNGNDFINLVHPEWTGAIPATLIRKKDKTLLLEKQVHLKELEGFLDKFKN
jgi:thiol-disulfide isomerase/thioredoxin